MIFMQKNACAVLQKQPQLPGILFSSVLITHGFFFFICITVASGGSHQDLSHVVLGAPVVALLLIHPDSFYSQVCRMIWGLYLHGTSTEQFSVLSFAGTPAVRVSSGLLKGVTTSLAAAPRPAACCAALDQEGRGFPAFPHTWWVSGRITQSLPAFLQLLFQTLYPADT